MITVTAQIQNAYFDRRRVIKQIGRDNARRLGRMGAFVRTRAQKSVLRNAPKRKSNRRKAHSGKPPRVRTKSKYASLRNIQFGLGPGRESVVIGPLAIPHLAPKGSSAKTVPELLTKGGTAQVKQYAFSSSDNAKWYMGHFPQAPHQRSVRAQYFDQPFMQIALDREVAVGTVANVWSR